MGAQGRPAADRAAAGDHRPGSAGFLYGTHRDFTAAQLASLYYSDSDYRHQVRDVVQPLVGEHFVLPEDGRVLIDQARHRRWCNRPDPPRAAGPRGGSLRACHYVRRGSVRSNSATSRRACARRRSACCSRTRRPGRRRAAASSPRR
ncbi:alpha/beta hydrolase domain-containing protein [Amycolatopsis acidiphila]|uniref:alpha/beta hydrolase domain-containing protein n=1 Tax=Amycolatopsis acidiphila TaxID=715473 RepID=UPI003898E769